VSEGGVVFLTVLFFLFFASLFFLYLEQRRSRKHRLLMRLKVQSGQGSGRRLEVLGGGLRRFLERFINIGWFEALILAADVNISIEKFLIITLSMGVVFLLPCLFAATNIFVMAFFAGVGMSCPALYLVYLRRKREEALLKQLPDAIDMIIRALRAGQSVDRALRDVGGHLSPPMGPEIRAIYDGIAMGLPFETAIRNFEAGFPRLSDVKILCTAFIVQRETGGNLTGVLEGLSKAIRERLKLRMQVRAMTAEGRATALVIGLIPVVFALVTWLLSPGYINMLLHASLGRKILLIALSLDVLGLYLMKKLVRVEI